MLLADTTIVFDLDGTLIDTAPDLIAAADHALVQANYERSEAERLRPWISFGARRMIVEALAMQNATATGTQLDTLHDVFLTHYEANIAASSRPFAGAVPLLYALKQDGATLAICTNKREQLATSLLSQLGLKSLFKAVVGRDTLPVCKPDPAHLLQTIARANGSPTQAIMIGDSKTDVDTARNAGVPVIGVTFGYTDTPMAQLAPDRLIASFGEALQAITDLVQQQRANPNTQSNA
ncbi:MAG: HAD family hydrolase [Pseudomonadota bacterium]